MTRRHSTQQCLAARLDTAEPGGAPPDAATASDASTRDAATATDAGSTPAPTLDPDIVTMLGQVNAANLSAVDHYVLAGRATTENFYRTRRSTLGSVASATASATDLGLSDAPSFFVSVAAVDAQGHESPFAHPEFRCDSSGCVVQAGSLDVTTRN